ncbi:hypothetical protein VNO78_21870 [Psophocarpus tetragonolobus]|uniref:Uncharacterized protein n=1 Tax=Psophocarpus tetragonolobus TaxID=3891 RepID=A0AAN9SFX3_PSOTE
MLIPSTLWPMCWGVSKRCAETYVCPMNVSAENNAMINIHIIGLLSRRISLMSTTTSQRDEKNEILFKIMNYKYLCGQSYAKTAVPALQIPWPLVVQLSPPDNVFLPNTTWCFNHNVSQNFILLGSSDAASDGGDDPCWLINSLGHCFNTSKAMLAALLISGSNRTMTNDLMNGVWTGSDQLLNSSYASSHCGQVEREHVIFVRSKANIRVCKQKSFHNLSVSFSRGQVKRDTLTTRE